MSALSPAYHLLTQTRTDRVPARPSSAGFIYGGAAEVQATLATVKSSAFFGSGRAGSGPWCRRPAPRKASGSGRQPLIEGQPENRRQARHHLRLGYLSDFTADGAFRHRIGASADLRGGHGRRLDGLTESLPRSRHPSGQRARLQ